MAQCDAIETGCSTRLKCQHYLKVVKRRRQRRRRVHYCPRSKHGLPSNMTALITYLGGGGLLVRRGRG